MIPGSKVRNPGSKARNPASTTKDPRFKAMNPGSIARNSKSKSTIRNQGSPQKLKIEIVRNSKLEIKERTSVEWFRLERVHQAIFGKLMFLLRNIYEKG